MFKFKKRRIILAVLATFLAAGLTLGAGTLGAGTFNSPLQSMTLEEDGIYQAAAVVGTDYEVANYSGAGVLNILGWYSAAASSKDFEITITTDGNAKSVSFDSVSQHAKPFRVIDENTSALHGLGLEFTETLVVEIANQDAGAQNIGGSAWYMILSEEFKREIIAAGQPVPDRAGNPRINPDGSIKTYAQDIMLVWFCHKVVDGKPTGAISNKVQHPKHKRMEISYAADGTAIGEMSKYTFDTTVKGDRYSRSVDTSDNGVHILTLKDKKEYKVKATNGLLENSKLPKLKKPDPIDATLTTDNSEK